MKSLKKIVIVISIVFIALFVFYTLLNQYFGWYAYEKWKYRLDTRGNRHESMQRNVFVKDAIYNIALIDSSGFSFDAFYEKAYSFGKHSSKDTRIYEPTTYPYQLSFTQSDTANHVFFSLSSKTRVDSLNFYCVYLKEPGLPDTVYIDVIKNSNDTIGEIKVYD